MADENQEKNQDDMSGVYDEPEDEVYDVYEEVVEEDAVNSYNHLNNTTRARANTYLSIYVITCYFYVTIMQL